jgi:catechol 2,3-dioxygenase-like lactoylglutathione lyase family enzyme
MHGKQAEHEELVADSIAGWLAGKSGEDAFFGSMVSNFIGCTSADCSYPSPEERSFAYLSGHIEGTRHRKSIGLMSLLVIRAGDLERSRAFYSKLGLELSPEKHGDGPFHYSSELDGTVIELYPTKAPTASLRVGLRIPTPEIAVQSLMSSGFLKEAPSYITRDSGPSVCVVRDPDGNTVELSAL